MYAARMLAAIVAAAIATQATASAAHTPAGPWRLSAIGGKVGCTLSLTDHERSGGHDLQTPQVCERAFPPLRGLSVWTVDSRGALLFSDPARSYVVSFLGPLGGPYAATAPDGRLWRLAAATPRPSFLKTP